MEKKGYKQKNKLLLFCFFLVQLLYVPITIIVLVEFKSYIVFSILVGVFWGCIVLLIILRLVGYIGRVEISKIGIAYKARRKKLQFVKKWEEIENCKIILVFYAKRITYMYKITLIAQNGQIINIYNDDYFIECLIHYSTNTMLNEKLINLKEKVFDRGGIKN